MDTNELKQEIEKQAAKIIGRKYDQDDSDFQKVVALYILLQLENDVDNQERMEVFMPKMLEAVSGIGGSEKLVRDLQNHNIHLQNTLAEAQDMLRRLAVETTKHAMETVGRSAGIVGEARFEMLVNQDDVYDLEETLENVDWRAVHDLRIQAPRYLDFGYKDIEAWADEGVWMYVDKHGFNEAHVTGLGYINEDVAAVYHVCSSDWDIDDLKKSIEDDDHEMLDKTRVKALLYWERRFLYTAQMSKGRQEDLKREMKKGARTNER